MKIAKILKFLTFISLVMLTEKLNSYTTLVPTNFIEYHANGYNVVLQKLTQSVVEQYTPLIWSHYVSIFFHPRDVVKVPLSNDSYLLVFSNLCYITYMKFKYENGEWHCKYVKWYFEHGYSEGGLLRPTGLSASKIGSTWYVFIADRGNHTVVVLRYNQQTDELEYYDLANLAIERSPHDVVSFGERGVLVLDTGNGRIVLYRAYPHYNGYITYRCNALSHPVAVDAIAIDDNAYDVYVADRGSRKVIQLRLTYIEGEGWQQPQFIYARTFPSGAKLSGIAVNSDGVYVTDQNNCKVIGLTRDLYHVKFEYGSQGTGTGQFMYPRSIYVKGNEVVIIEQWGENSGIQYYKICTVTPPSLYLVGCWSGLDSCVHLHWNYYAGDYGPEVHQYDLYRGNLRIGRWHGTGDSLPHSYVDDYNLQPGQSVIYKLYAYDEPGDVCATAVDTVRRSNSGCPFLYVLTKDGWKPDNNLLPANTGLANVHDYYLLKVKPLMKDSVYTLMLKEPYNDVSLIDQLELYVIDHPKDIKVLVLPNGKIISVKRTKGVLTPIACINQHGDDLTPYVQQCGDVFIKGHDGDTLTFIFELPDDYLKAEIDGGGSADGSGKGSSGDPLPMAKEGNTFYFRENPSTVPFQFTYNTSSMLVTVKIAWSGDYNLDYMEFYPEIDTSEGKSYKMSTAPLLVDHPTLKPLISEDNRYVKLTKHDSLVVNFAAPPLAHTAWERDFLLHVVGFYFNPLTREPINPLEIINKFTAYVIPNPTSSSIRVRFAIPDRSANVKLEIYDITGRLIWCKHLTFEKPGYYEVQLPTAELTSGSYFWRATYNTITTAGKFVVIK